MDDFGLSEEYLSHYERVRRLPDGRIIGMAQLMFHWTIHIDLDYSGYSDKYCFATHELALAAMEQWDGTGDPKGWHRHLNTGRRRNLQTGEEWIQW